MSLCTLYLLACQERDTVGDSDLCCCVCVLRLSSTNELPCLLTLVDIGWLLFFLLFSFWNAAKCHQSLFLLLFCCCFLRGSKITNKC